MGLPVFSTYFSKIKNPESVVSQQFQGFFTGAEGGIRTLARVSKPSTPLASYGKPPNPLCHNGFGIFFLTVLQHFCNFCCENLQK